MIEREQIITYLLQRCDALNKVVEDLQKKVAEQQKELDLKNQSK